MAYDPPFVSHPYYRKTLSIWNRRVLLFSLFLILSPDSFGQETAKKLSAFKDSTDHALDISDWLVNKKGVLILPSIITEPAVGYGALAAVVYFHSSYSEKSGPPSMSGAVGGGTQRDGLYGRLIFDAIAYFPV